ncbi:hypothetical protein ACFQ1Q_08495 [Winogradskyella litorisediminis]|uniref:Lipoprotein n=1 Tax=Winogradskyella litorisediminis TaxID=1156618 RepID=A0ABW3N9Q1_9FLAO
MKNFKNFRIKKVVLIFVLFVVLGCSGDDDAPEQPVINVTNLRVLAQDGFNVGVGSCINPNENYLVEITISTQNSVQLIEPVVVSYTVNGNTSSVTFTEIGIKTIPVNFVTGENVVELVDSGDSVTLNVIAPTQFELIP